jgi:hypothetical protein
LRPEVIPVVLSVRGKSVLTLIRISVRGWDELRCVVTRPWRCDIGLEDHQHVPLVDPRGVWIWWVRTWRHYKQTSALLFEPKVWLEALVADGCANCCFVHDDVHP